MIDHSPVRFVDEATRTPTAMQKVAQRSGFSHISQLLEAELRRLVDRLAEQVSDEEKAA